MIESFVWGYDREFCSQTLVIQKQVTLFIASFSDTVCLLLRCGASTTIPDCSGSGPLHLAAWKGDLEVVKVLISQGPSRANVNQQNDTDNTPLHLAAQYGYSTVVEYLLQVRFRTS